MKKTLILFSCLLCLISCFACDINPSEDSSNTESYESSADVDETVSSENISDLSEDSSNTDDVVPPISTDNILYNNTAQDGWHWVHDAEHDWFDEWSHYGLSVYLRDNEVPEDTCFLVAMHLSEYDVPRLPTEPLLDYLKRMGYVENEELTKLFNERYDWFRSCEGTIGYINEEIYNKLDEDNYAIKLEWIPESCSIESCYFHGDWMNAG